MKQRYGAAICTVVLPTKEFEKTVNFLKAQKLLRLMNKLTGKQHAVKSKVLDFLEDTVSNKKENLLNKFGQ